jgi:hypothetical protein
MLLMIFYRRISDLRNTPTNSINFGFAPGSITDKVIQQQLDLLNNIGMFSLTSSFNHSKMVEAESMLKEELDRKIHSLSRNSEDFIRQDN